MQFALFRVAGIGGMLVLALAAACSSSSKPTTTGRGGGDGGTSQNNPVTPGTGRALVTVAPIAQGTLQAGSASAAAGSTVQVTIEAPAVPAPGLGAWAFNVQYDPAIVSVADCAYPGAGACNRAYKDNAIRLASAPANGLTGNVILATLTFPCKAAGTSDLKLSVDLIADATVGNPRAVANTPTQGGSITCS